MNDHETPQPPVPTAGQPSWQARLAALDKALIPPYAGQSGSQPPPTASEQRTTQLMMAFGLALGVLILVSIPASTAENQGMLAAIAASSLGAYILGRTPWYRLGSPLLIGGFAVSCLALAVRSPNSLSGIFFAILPSAFILSAALLSVNGLIGFSALMVAVLAGMAVLMPDHRSAVFSSLGGVLAMSLVLIIVSVHRANNERARLAELISTNEQLNAIKSSLEQNVAERTRKAEEARRDAEMTRRQVEDARNRLQLQSWQVAGRAQLSDRMRGEQTPELLAAGVCQQLCEYLNGQLGVLYLRQDSTLTALGGYGFVQGQSNPTLLNSSAGLLHQAATDQKIVLLSDLPAGSLKIATGLGDIQPNQVIITPLVYEQQTIGLVEMATMDAFSPQHIQFLYGVAESIAIALRTAQTRFQVNQLLAETQRQAEEMQAQEEELRAINEELTAQTESLRAANLAQHIRSERRPLRDTGPLTGEQEGA